ncbi:uncharacterized protein LOC124883730 isoform X2 [Girardinichthys multiradiatus]|uniref:uncharacterized protein LOC124883730 isoform X2 n=1 Tax=Girardinichthys multiradiatus TaxID=208333 RepID=UPI001FADF113|nr:uncharacterized protein LOC124883730 isoform X2 [Girardinichthys multiradiatus]
MIRMHYSFDFAQQMHFPSNPLQPGPMYFLTPRKCGLFGVSCEGLQKQVVENSSPESRLNIPQLVGLEDGTVFVNMFYWQAHLNPYFRKLPQIKSYQHFSFDAKRLGVVLARTHSDAEPVSFQLLCDPDVLPPVDCFPAQLAPGLATDRQTYLYSKIRPFCSDEAQDITCPAPQSTTQNGTQKRMMV